MQVTIFFFFLYFVVSTISAQVATTAELGQLAGIPPDKLLGGPQKKVSYYNEQTPSTDDLPLDVRSQLSQEEVSTLPTGVLATKEVTSFVVDEERKKRDTVALVKKEIDFLKNHRLAEACYAFMYNKDFNMGDIVPFLYSGTEGTVFVRDGNTNSTWQNIKGYKNAHGVDVFELVRQAAVNGGGWIQYEWKGGYKLSYVEQVIKDKNQFLVGAGWFPVNKRARTEEFVRSAVNFFNENGGDEAFRRFSNPIGDFISGDLYIFAYKFDGQCVAHGDNPALIGRDFSEDPLIRSIIEKAKQGGGWIEYQWKHAPKVAYIEKVTDVNGDYAIGSGYYPDSNRDTVVSMVKRAVKFFNAWGRERASQEFSLADGQFIYGDLYIAMYDFNGKCIAIIQSTGKRETIKIKASTGNGIQDAVLELKVD